MLAGARGRAAPHARFHRGHSERERERRRLFLEGYSFPPALRERLRAEYDPELSGTQLTLLLEGLRAWFLACLFADGKTLGMPSRAVDDAWHAFILMTREYHAFCEEAFGSYLHHAPEATMAEPLAGALARTLAVIERHSIAAQPSGGENDVPLLFAIDSELGIEDGHDWRSEDVERLRRGGWTGGAMEASCGAASGADGSCAGASCGGASCGGASCGGAAGGG